MTKMRHSLRFVFLPFSLAGCGSNSSVAVGDTNESREAVPETKESALMRIKGGEQSKYDVKTNPYSVSFARMQRLFRGIRNVSKIFVYKEEDNEEEEKEMEIGFPTDVKHVTHIGLDGLTRNNIVKVLDDFGAVPETPHVPTISLHDYEMAMAAQTHSPFTKLQH